MEKCLIYEVKLSICDNIYIGKIQNTFKKRMDGHLSDLLHLLKNGQKSDSFTAHFIQHFKSTMSFTYLRKLITLKVVNHINPIVAKKT